MNKGIWNAVGAYLMWGFLPVYWKALQNVTSLQILGHRVVWSFILLALILSMRKDWASLRFTIRDWKTARSFVLAACLLAVNWLTYIWAVNAGFIIETSLGYFINPLVNVLLGVIFLHEELRTWQWIPVGLAGLGVLYLTVSYGSLPWIALLLAFSFAAYGFVKKKSPLGSLHGLAVETAILFIPASSYLFFTASQGNGSFVHAGLSTTLLLMFTGIVTALPLLFFGTAAQKINLSLLGLLQYIAPTCQFLIGILVYNEPFTRDRLIGFGFIWVALLIYSLEGFLNNRKPRKIGN